MRGEATSHGVSLLAKLQPVRGTHDLLPEDSRRHAHVSGLARDIAARYGYGEISTPIFEFTEVFQRTLGDTSDIVTKEMYTFADRGGSSLTLRPENTAGVARALISGGLSQNLPLKFFYNGPMFRYERPQKGRLRQFHQIGAELLGVPEPLGDIEVITLGAHVLNDIGVLGKTALELNSLGDAESRAAYRDALVGYLSDHVDALSEESRERLARNPLRILDSKNDSDRAVIRNAPRLEDSLNEQSRAFFSTVCEGLDRLGIAFTHNTHLVRGLDYYCHTAFEFTTTELGAQGAVLAGGRYDGLVETMGGPATPGVGWAAGLERLAMLADTPPDAPRPVAVIPIGDDAQSVALEVTNQLRRAGFTVDLGFRGNLSKRMKKANQARAVAAVIIGEDEIERGAATVRDLESGDQQEIPFDSLAGALGAYKHANGNPS